METLLQENLIEVVIGGIVAINVIVWGFVIARTVTRRRLHLSAWGSFAESVRLQLDPGGLFRNPRVSGDYSGRSVELSTYHRTRSGYSRAQTKLAVSTNNQNFRSLKLSRYGAVMGLLDRAVLGKGIEVGDPDFDRLVGVRGDPAEMAKHALDDPMLRSALMELRRGAEIRMRQSDRHLIYENEGLERDAAYLARLLDALCGLAGRIESWQPPGSQGPGSE